MTKRAGKLAATIVLAASLPLASVAPAAPISHALAIKNAVPAAVETVQFRRWGWEPWARSECWRCSCGCRICCVADKIAAAGGPVAYCMQRYRSYDPGSGTFLGYDGQRHPCPRRFVGFSY